jgi:hypothetical protein
MPPPAAASQLTFSVIFPETAAVYGTVTATRSPLAT